MKRELLKILVIIAAAVALAVGVNGYLDSREMTFQELAQELRTAAGSLVASGKAEDSGDMESTAEVSDELNETEGNSGAESDAEEGTELVASEDAADGAAAEMTEDAPALSEGEEEGAPPDADMEQDGEEQLFANPKDGKRPPSGNRDTDFRGVFTDAYQIEDFEIIYQMPELPTGCEVVALTMVLRYYGFDVDKTTMAADYLPTADATFYYGSDGLKYGPDLNQYFVGNPFTDGGYICGTGAIVTAANSYLSDVGSDLRAVDLTGTSVEELYQLVSEDIPVVVWVTIEMAQRASTSGWYTESGEYVEWSTNDHGAVLIGYTEDTVIIADPLSGLIEYSREDFESVFESRGNQCVILQ